MCIIFCQHKTKFQVTLEQVKYDYIKLIIEN